MLLGPIFQVELVSTSRRARYFVLRVVYGLLLLAMLWTCYENSSANLQFSEQPLSTQRSSAMASEFFMGLAWLQTLAILSVGPSLAIGTIATERERRTIEYLFVTDLSDREIVLSKATARLLLLFKMILVGLPILFLFRLFGGIPVGALLTLFLLSASLALMVTALSIFVSVWSARSRDATVRIYLLLAVLFLIPLILNIAGPAFGRSSWVWTLVLKPAVDALLVINPIWALIQALGSRFAMGLGLNVSGVLRTVFWQTILSGAALLSATFAVRGVHLAESSRGVRRLFPRWPFRLPRWKPALGTRPMLWKEMFADTAKTRLGVIGVIAVALILATVAGLTGYAFWEAVYKRWGSKTSSYFEYLSMITALLGSGILILLGSRAASLVAHEKESETWDSLLATPLSGSEIMFAKMWGNLYSIRWALVVLAGIWGLGLILDLRFLWAIVVLAATFGIHCWYATNLGLTFSLHCKTSLQAMGGTLATLIFFGGGYMFCCCAVMVGGGGSQLEELMLAPCIPFQLIMPPQGYLELVDAYSFRRFEDEMAVAYILGVIAYLVVATILTLVMTSRFDEISGRITDMEATRTLRAEESHVTEE